LEAGGPAAQPDRPFFVMTAPDTPSAPPADSDAPAGNRVFSGAAAHLIAAFAVAVSLAHIYFNTLGTLSTLWQTALHFSGLAILCGLYFPMLRRAPSSRILLVIDTAIGVLAAVCAAFLINQESAIYERGVRMTPIETAAALFCILAALELVRRTTGWIIPVIIIIALTYVVWWGAWIDGVFRFPGMEPETVLFRSIYNDEGMFGTIARISSTVVFMFILFAAFLVRSGATDVIIDLARLVVGRFVGGPGLVAVFASGLMGTISGSAIANTTSTGSVTIPLMKGAGFPPRFAAGVEAAASTGGQIMPPIMGAGAFVMANFTGISYTEIIAVSAVPALLYFLSVGFFVRIEAKKHGLGGDTELPKFADVMRRGGIAFLLPIGVLIYLLIDGFTPTFAAGFAIIAVVLASWLTPNRMGLRAIVDALALGARNMITVGILLVAIGLVVNVVASTGVGNTISLMIARWSGDSLLIAVTLVALASLVLGMGLPVTAAYIVLAVVSAPALADLITQSHLIDAFASGNVPEDAKAIFLLVAPERMGEIGLPMSTEDAAALLQLVPADFASTLSGSVLSPATVTAALLSAHLIIFWLSQDSNVTPPVCLAAFAAAAIARTPPMLTGFTAWKIAKGLYIVPLLFAYTDLVGGTTAEVLTIAGFAVVGLYALSAGLQGYLETPLNWPLRAIALLAGGTLLWPGGWPLHLAGLALFGMLLAWNLIGKRRASAVA
jgi:TRAP transporter 4TM/12TM fusion protein